MRRLSEACAVVMNPATVASDAGLSLYHDSQRFDSLSANEFSSRGIQCARKDMPAASDANKISFVRFDRDSTDPPPFATLRADANESRYTRTVRPFALAPHSLTTHNTPYSSRAVLLVPTISSGKGTDNSRLQSAVCAPTADSLVSTCHSTIADWLTISSPFLFRRFCCQNCSSSHSSVRTASAPEYTPSFIARFSARYRARVHN